MKIKLILLLFIASSNCLKSDAPYIQQNDRPIIAGHRGLSTLFPGTSIMYYKKIQSNHNMHACTKVQTL